MDHIPKLIENQHELKSTIENTWLKLLEMEYFLKDAKNSMRFCYTHVFGSEEPLQAYESHLKDAIANEHEAEANRLSIYDRLEESRGWIKNKGSHSLSQSEVD
jgi:hypothetical protein